jgi:mRNA interferase MazF
VVLVHFPFTSLRASKKRPAVVVSPTEFSARNDDVVVMALTGVGQAGETPALDDWPEAGLVKPTWVKPLLATLALEVIAKRLGRLSARDCRKVAEALRAAIAGEFLHR